jgi:hypothetical protein
MIKKLTLATFLISTSLFAQTEPSVRRCGTMEHMEYLKQQDPGLEQQLKEYNETLQQWIAKNPEGSKSRAVRTIPIVFHVIYNAAAENISDAQILSQLKAVNEDFSRTNADASQTPAAFQSVAGNPNIQFCMAQRDPSGKATNGIVRKQTTKTGWSTDDAVKSTAKGGDDAWDVTKYYNIWVCNFTDATLLGYGEFPTGTASKTYGYVGTYKYTGTTSNVKPPFNKGRTTTHEMGHCFNLFHIWGDENACTGTDQCADTPNQAKASGGKPTYPLKDACTTVSPGVMFMNYMDYSDDDVMNMFTVGQVARMDAVINNAPYNKLLTSNGCSPLTGIDDEIANSYELNVFPNPNDGNFTLSFNGVEKADYQIDLKNALGQSVYTETVNGFVGNYAKALNLEKYGKGVYMISISNTKHQAVQKMIIY